MKKSTSYKVFTVFNTIFMCLLGVIMIYPYLNQLAIAFNESADTALGGIYLLPRKLTFQNFGTILTNPRVGTAAVVSVLKTVINTVLALLVTFSAAYALSRKNLKGRAIITKLYAVTMYLSAGVVPTYILYRHLGLINNFWVYILPYTFSFYNMVIMRSFIQQLPASLEEAALIDGANELTIMMKVVIPLSKPVLATVALWVAVGQWNEYTTTLYYITDRSLYSLQYLMMSILKQNETLRQAALDAAMGASEKTAQQPASESIKAAMMIVTTVPIICLYPFLQKYFVKGVTLGAVKE